MSVNYYQLPNALAAERLLRDPFPTGIDVPAHFSLTPDLTDIEHGNTVFPTLRASDIRQRISQIYVRHELTRCPNFGLYYAGHHSVIRADPARRTILLVVELARDQLDCWRFIHDDVRAVRDFYDLDGSHVLLRYFRHWDRDDITPPLYSNRRIVTRLAPRGPSQPPAQPLPHTRRQAIRRYMTIAPGNPQPGLMEPPPIPQRPALQPRDAQHLSAFTNAAECFYRGIRAGIVHPPREIANLRPDRDSPAATEAYWRRTLRANVDFPNDETSPEALERLRLPPPLRPVPRFVGRDRRPGPLEDDVPEIPAPSRISQPVAPTADGDADVDEDSGSEDWDSNTVGGSSDDEYSEEENIAPPSPLLRPEIERPSGLMPFQHGESYVR